MRWTPGGMSDDIEDRRGDDSSSGMGFIPGGGRGLGIGGVIILGVLSVIFKTDLLSPFMGGGTSVPMRTSSPDPGRKQREERLAQFVSFTIDDLQNFWTKALPEQTNVPYQRSKLVLFWDQTRSGCGEAESATGPFYCPADNDVYIDLDFYGELKEKFGAPGEFAQAYVIAHEVGHHIQDLLGTERKVRQIQRQRPDLQNRLSVAMELQADCYAGVWGYSAAQRNVLEPGDAEAGLNAAAAIGDDRLQKMATGRVMPERFTHGSSAQRTEWFKRGLTNGKVSACDTFGSAQ